MEGEETDTINIGINDVNEQMKGEETDTDTINIGINDVNEQVFEKHIKQIPSKRGWYVFNPDNVSDEEKETLKTILFCCNTKFFLNKDNTDYNKPEILSNAVSVLQEKLVKDAVLLKELARQNGAKTISILSPPIESIKSKPISSGIHFKDNENNEYYVYYSDGCYCKQYADKNYSDTNHTIEHDNMIIENKLHIMNGEFIDRVHAKGTYIIISKNLIKNPTENEIIIDICYNYENKDAPNIQVGGGSAFRITLTQQKDKYTLKEIKKGYMVEDKVDENSLSETNENAIQKVIDDEMRGQSLRETLAEEPELCKVLQEAKVITKKQYEQIMSKNTIEEEFKEENTTTPKYNLWCLPNPCIGKNQSTGKWGCCGIDCC